MTSSVPAIHRIAVVLGISLACVTARAQSTSSPEARRFPPPQIEMFVPFEPRAFPSAGRTHLLYELHLQNFERGPFTLIRVQVLDADTATLRPVATFEGSQLEPMVQPTGASSSASDRLSLTGGGHSVLFMFVAFEAGTRVPHRIGHRIVTNNGSIDGADIGTQSTRLLDLGSPLTGAEWHALSGPGNDSNHRRGILAFDGKATICRRYAIDWVLMRDGARFNGNALDNASYYAYGQEVLAVAAGRVVSVVNGIPDNVPDRQRFSPAVPLSRDTLFGNSIVLDVGDGQFAHFLHLQPNSVLVKPGDRVRRGDVLARVGNSGDSRQPHLHFELTNSAKPILGEGVPYVLSRYRARLADGSWQTRMRELPLSDTVIDFGTGR